MKRLGRFAGAASAAMLLLAQAFALVPAASAQSAGQPVEGLKGFSTGQDLHASVLEAGTTRLVNADVAWSGASVDAGAAGLAGAKLNEVNRIFQPSKPGKLSYARGSGLEIGLGTTPTDPNQIILAGFTDAAAPPPTAKDTDLLGPLSAPPLAYASALRGIAVANGNSSGLLPDVCVVGDDLSRGVGYAADAQLLDTGSALPNGQLGAPLVATDDTNPNRTVAQTLSHEMLVPSGKSNNFGLMSEVRETIAPITILQNRTGQPARLITIEVLGEWVLRAVATGSPGGASIFYGPGTVNPQTPVLSIIDSTGAVNRILSLQDLLGSGGLDIPIPGLLDITVGEAPRAIAKPGAAPDYGSKPTTAADGTLASAAVDVVRIRLLDGSGADIRLGHMEVSAQAPAGGVNCPIPVTKTADPDSIKINAQPDTSHISITVNNSFACDLQGVTLTDDIHRKNAPDAGDPDFQLTAVSPPNSGDPSIPTGAIKSATVTWNLGTIPKGKTATVTLDLKSATSPGIIEDVAHAFGKLANCTGQNTTGINTSGLSIAGLNLSGTSVPVAVRVEGELARTGATALPTAVAGAVLAALAVGLRFGARRRRGSAD